MGRTRRDAALTTGTLDAERAPVWVMAEVVDVRLVRLEVAAEDVLGGGAPPEAQAGC